MPTSTNDSSLVARMRAPLLQHFFANPEPVMSALRQASATLAPWRGTAFDLQPGLDDVLAAIRSGRRRARTWTIFSPGQPERRVAEPGGARVASSGRPESTLLLQAAAMHPPEALAGMFDRYRDLARTTFPDVGPAHLLTRAKQEIADRFAAGGGPGAGVDRFSSVSRLAPFTAAFFRSQGSVARKAAAENAMEPPREPARPEPSWPPEVTIGEALWDRAGDMGLRFADLAQKTDEGLIRFAMHPIDTTVETARGIAATQAALIDRFNEGWSGGIYRAPDESRAIYEQLRSSIASLGWDDAPDMAWALGLAWVGGQVPRGIKLGGDWLKQRGRVTAYRVEGDPNMRILIGGNGRVAVLGDEPMLFLNFGDEARAREYLRQKIAKGLPWPQLKSFEVRKDFVDELKKIAVKQDAVDGNSHRPQIVDPTKASNQFGLRPEQVKALERAIIQGTGKTH